MLFWFLKLIKRSILYSIFGPYIFSIISLFVMYKVMFVIINSNVIVVSFISVFGLILVSLIMERKMIK